MAAHLIGYVGEVTDAQLARPEYKDVQGGAVVGQAGVEQTYNPLLMGADGARHVIVNSRGREIDVLGEEEPVEGRRLQLTIDADVQRAAEEAFRHYGFRGAAIALAPSQRRGARAVVAAGLRPQRVRGGHRPHGVERPAHRPAASAEQPGHPGPVLAGIDLQDCGGGGRARGGRDHAGDPHLLRRRRHLLRALLQVPQGRRARLGRRCARRSRSPATCTSTRSATCSASTACTSGRRRSASAR